MQGDLGAWLDAASGTDEEFVDRIWRLAVRRPPEPDEGSYQKEMTRR